MTRQCPHCSTRRRPQTLPPLVEHAHEAGRWAALAIGSLDRDAPTAREAISLCLYHLLVVCVFADTAADR